MTSDLTVTARALVQIQTEEAVRGASSMPSGVPFMQCINSSTQAVTGIGFAHTWCVRQPLANERKAICNITQATSVYLRLMATGFDHL